MVLRWRLDEFCKMSKDDKLKVLKKRLETFFEIDRDINRDTNIKNAYLYGYIKSDIAEFLEISHTAVSKILMC